MLKKQTAVLVILTWITLGVVLVNPSTSGSEMQYYFGYSEGDSFTFRDSTSERLHINQTQLYKEVMHQFKTTIKAIDENIAGYRIRLTTEIMNLSLGIDSSNYTIFMEGHSSIVAAPRVLFTHTLWVVHSSEFLSDASDYQATTQMNGTVGEYPDFHLFYWNLSRYIDETVSPYDMDGDGNMDAYMSISGYLAQFNNQGVLLLREFITEFRFENGAHYYRLRQIVQIFDSPSTLPGISVELGFVVGLIVIVTIILSIITLYWFRRGLSSLD